MNNTGGFMAGVILVLSLGVAVPVAAGEPPAEIASDLSYLFSEEELFISATQSARKLNQAPAIATVITAKQLREMGARSLLDALDIVPGFGVSYPSEFAIENTFEVRGIKTAEAEKILLMINDHPVNAAFSGSWAQMFDEFPVDSIQRIEIIRGPGSALYGANAFVAVINIIMKEAGGSPSLEVIGGTGDDDQVRQFFEAEFSVGDAALVGSFDHFRTQGSREFIERDAAGRSGRTNFWRDISTSYFSGRYKDFRLTGLLVRKEKGSPLTITNQIDTETDWFGRQAFVEAGYRTRLGVVDLDLKVSGDFVWLDPVLQLSVPGFAETSKPSLKTRGFHPSVKAVLPPFAGNHVTLGAEYQDISQYDVEHFLDGVDVGDFLNHNQEVSRQIYAFYLQDEWELTDSMIFTAGVRFDHYSDFGSSINPRLAFVWNFAEQFDLKILYGRAFRAPTFLELYEINNPSAIGNPDLDPEVMNTYEAGFAWHMSPGYLASMNVFYNRFSDRIVRQAPEAVNEGGANIWGVETEMRADLRESLYGYVNYGYQETEDRETGEELPDVPRHRLKLGVNAGFLGDRITTNLGIRWTGERPRAGGDPRGDTDASTVTDLAVMVRDCLIERFDVTLKVHNILDEEVFDPSPPIVPEGYPRPGRTWFLEGRYRF